MQIAGEHYHFRCAWHKVDGFFEAKEEVFPAKCGVQGCNNRAKCYWYRGSKFAELPVPRLVIETIIY
jgi:hypothetical protein